MRRSILLTALLGVVSCSHDFDPSTLVESRALAGPPIGTGAGITGIYDHGTQVADPVNRLDFAGAGVTVARSGTDSGRITLTFGGGGGGGGYATVQEEGVSLAQQTTLNFIGAAFTCVNNAGASRTDCTLFQTPSNAANVVGDTRAISVSGAALSGGGNLQADRTITLSESPNSASVVGTGRTITCGNALSGCGDLSADRTLAVTTSPATQTPVGTGRQVVCGPGLAGCGDFSADRTLLVSSAGTTARLATAAALPANTYVSAGCTADTITINATGTLTVDGVLTALNDRILVKNEATSANDGLYKVTTAGAVGVAAVLTRTSDMNTNAEFPGAAIFIAQGTSNGGTGWMLKADPDTAFSCGVTSQSWTQFTGTGVITAGNGISISGNTISVATTLPDNYSFTAAGTAANFTNNVTIGGTLTNSTHSAAGGVALVLTGNASGSKFVTTAGTGLDIDGFGGVNFKINGTLVADVGVTTAANLTLAANKSFAMAAGTGGLSFGSGTGDSNFPTGQFNWAGASGKTGSIVSTGAGITITAGGASIFSTSTGNFTLQTTGATTNIIVDATQSVLIGGTNATGVSLGRNSQLTQVLGRFTSNQNFEWNASNAATLGATENAFNAGANSTFDVTTIFRCTPNAGGSTINGIRTGNQGRFILLRNLSSTDSITVTHESGSATAAGNRIQLPNATNITIRPFGLAAFIYDNSNSRWSYFGI